MSINASRNTTTGGELTGVVESVAATKRESQDIPCNPCNATLRFCDDIICALLGDDFSDDCKYFSDSANIKRILSTDSPLLRAKSLDIPRIPMSEFDIPKAVIEERSSLFQSFCMTESTSNFKHMSTSC